VTRAVLTTTESGDGADIVGRQISRVGFASEPWAWTPCEFADGGRFTGRWDDPNGIWRTLYVGDSRLVCFIERLAPFGRPGAGSPTGRRRRGSRARQ
jgi:hypothetical protein